MVCPNCKSETNGLKLNNRLYCTECGFLLDQPEPAPLETLPAEEKVEKTVVLHDPEPEKEDKKPPSSPEPKIINENDEEFAIAPLEAEVEVLDLVEKEATKLTGSKKQEPIQKIESLNPKITKTKTKDTVIKRGRSRITHKKEGDFVLVKNEPDPIAEPEITAAEIPVSDAVRVELPPIPKTTGGHDEKTPDAEPEIKDNLKDDEATTLKINKPEKPIEKVVEEVRHEALHNEEPKPIIDIDIRDQTVETADTEKPEQKKSPTENPMLGYFQKAAAETKQPINRVNKKKVKKSSRKLWWSLGIVLGIILLLAGLVVYVNLFATNADNSLEIAQNKANFSHLSPQYIPAGYKLSYETNGSSTTLNYVYLYQPDKSRNITISAAKSNVTNSNLKERLIDTTGQDYTQNTVDNRDLWFVGDNTLYFADSGVLYTVKSSSDISKGELQAIALGLK